MSSQRSGTDVVAQATLFEGAQLPILQDPNRPLGTARVFLPYRPWALQPTLPVAVARFFVDGHDVTPTGVQVERCRLQPHAVADWREMTCTLRLPDVTHAVQATCLEGGEGGVAFVARLLCRASRYRGGWSFERQESGYIEATIVLSREDVEGTCELDVVAVRTGEELEPSPGVAAHHGARLSISPRWIVEVVEPEPPMIGAFEFAWVDFTDPQPRQAYNGEDAHVLRAVSTALSHVIFRAGAVPLLVVNDHHADVAQVLKAKGTVGRRARVRDVLVRQIAVGCWRALVVEAAEAWRSTEGDGPMWAPMDDDHWSTRVLVHAAKVSHPTSEAPVDDLLEDLVDSSTRPGRLTLISETLGAVGRDPIHYLVQEMST